MRLCVTVFSAIAVLYGRLLIKKARTAFLWSFVVVVYRESVRQTLVVVMVCRHEVAFRVRSRASIEPHGGKIGHARLKTCLSRETHVLGIDGYMLFLQETHQWQVK